MTDTLTAADLDRAIRLMLKMGNPPRYLAISPRAMRRNFDKRTRRRHRRTFGIGLRHFKALENLERLGLYRGGVL